MFSLAVAANDSASSKLISDASSISRQRILTRPSLITPKPPKSARKRHVVP